MLERPDEITADAVVPVDDKLEVRIMEQGMDALARTVVGTPDGARLSMDDAVRSLAAQGVTFGIDAAALEGVLDDTSGRWHTVARGKEPVNGEDARLEYKFRRTVTKAAKVRENDRVDFWELDLFEPCSIGQVLVEKIPATPGEPGTDVRGAAVAQKPGRDAQLPRGKGVEASADGVRLLAKLDGHVELLGDTVVVSDTFEIGRDVDMSTGNISYAGSVVVRGRVASGMTIKAGKDIEVFGLVESAQLEAGGDIALHRGVLASEGGRISAKGNITARYIERANVTADGFVKADAIMHSSIESGRYVLCDGSKGAIIGGRCAASEFIAAKTVGAAAGVLTELELGMSPNRLARLTFLSKDIARVRAEIDKLKHLLRLIGSVNVPGEPEVRAESRQKAAMTLRDDIMLLPKLLVEQEGLLAEQEAAKDGRAHISGSTYQGVRIILGSSMYQVTTQMEYATFRMDKELGRVISVPHEFTGVKEPRRSKR